MKGSYYFAIDPGPSYSAWVEYTLAWDRPLRSFCSEVPNDELAAALQNRQRTEGPMFAGIVLVLERMQSFGRPIGRDVLETARWSGRFEQAWFGGPGEATWLTSTETKKILGVPTGGGDAGVREALIDRWGGKEKAVGNKKNPGPLYGVHTHAWRALGLAVAAAEVDK